MIKENKNKNNYQEYLAQFFLENNITEREQQLYSSIVDKLEQVNRPITKWDNYDLDRFVDGLHSTSANTITKKFQYIKNIYKFICEKENKEVKNLYLISAPKKYIDKEKFHESILTEQQYSHLRKLLTVTDINGKEYNYRDKVLVELAWEGLTSDEIKNLKINDIDFEDRKEGKIAHIKLEDREVMIVDIETVDDIIRTIQQNEYYVFPSNKRKAQYMKMRETEYLIRAVGTNVGKKDTVANPSNLLRNVLIKDELTDSILGVDLGRIGLEDIRRSRAINMLQNGVSNEEVGEFMGKKTICDIYWLEEIALKFKRENDKLRELKNRDKKEEGDENGD